MEKKNIAPEKSATKTEGLLEEKPTRKNRPLRWRCKKFFIHHWMGITSILIPLFLLPIALIERSKAMRCLYMICLMVSYWIANVIPYAVTAMFPIFLLPLFNIESSAKIGSCYFSNVTILLVLSIMISKSFEQSNLHRRIAISVLSCVGFRPKLLHLVILTTTMSVSMFLPNIATSAVMFPIMKAVMIELEKQEILVLTVEDEEDMDGIKPIFPSNEALAFYLGLAYSANIGGVATLDGSGISLTFTHAYYDFFPTESIHWGWYFLLCFPLTVCLGVGIIIYLQFMLLGLWRNREFKTIGKVEKDELIKLEREIIGTITYYEVAVIIGFITMVTLVFFREPPGFEGYANKLIGDK